MGDTAVRGGEGPGGRRPHGPVPSLRHSDHYEAPKYGFVFSRSPNSTILGPAVASLQRRAPHTPQDSAIPHMGRASFCSP